MIRRLNYAKTVLLKLFIRLWFSLRYKDKAIRKERIKSLTTVAEKKYLQRYLYVLRDKFPTSDYDLDNVIWICWLQGEKNMPPVVKKCVASIRKHCSDYKIVILTNDNIHRYITFPEYIARKRYSGKISNTHFSDILRVALLAKYGGIWLDATVYLTAPLPPEILNADFFAYHVKSFVHNNNWFIKSRPGNILMENMRNLLLEYWKYENNLLNYFFYHIFFDLMVEENQECAAQWEKTPLLYDDCYELEANFFKPYSQDKWQEINEKTHIHKLSWKYKQQPHEGDFLTALLSDALEGQK